MGKVRILQNVGLLFINSMPYCTLCADLGGSMENKYETLGNCV